MNPLEKILGSQKHEHEKFQCPSCQSEFFWRSVYGSEHCWGCDPAPVEAMVAWSNLVDQSHGPAREDVTEFDDFGWVECTDGQYRDYFVDDGRMWLVDESDEGVKWTLVR